MNAKIEKFVKDNGIDVTLIKDFEYFEKWIDWKNKPIIKNPIVIASDKSKVKLSFLRHKLKQAIAHLPEKEQSVIMVKKKVWEKTIGKANSFKHKAYGIDNLKRNIEGAKKKDGMLLHKAPEILELYGRMFSNSEIHEIVVSEWGIPCSANAINEFRKRNIDLITEKQEAYRRDISGLRLGVKRSRLEEYTDIFKHTKKKYTKEGHSNANAKLMMDVLRAVKEEVEGDLDVRISGGLDIKLENTLNAHIHHNLLQEMHLNQMIISRVAQKMDVNVFYLLEKLNGSFYAKFNRLNGEDNFLPESERILPSQQEYDFDTIRKKHKEIEEANELKVKEIELEEEARSKKTDNQDFKTELIKKLELQKIATAINKRKAIIRDLEMVEKRGDVSKVRTPRSTKRGHKKTRKNIKLK